MSTEILQFTPTFDLQEDSQWKTNIFQGDSGKEKRSAKWSQDIRTLRVGLSNQVEADVDALWDFYRARKGRYDSFWVKFPTKKNSVVLSEAVGSGNGSQTVFVLDQFPTDLSSPVLYHNGTPQSSGFSIANNLTTEKAEITYSVAPSGGVVITADYEYYVQVRFMEDRLSREMFQARLFNLDLTLMEVLWGTFVKP